MKVGDSGVVLSHESDRIAAGVGMVAGVEKKRDQLRLGRVEESLDLILILDVRLSMGMKDQSEPVIGPGDFSNTVGRVHQALESCGVQVDRSDRRAGPLVRIKLFNQRQEAGAKTFQGWRRTAQRMLEFGPARRI